MHWCHHLENYEIGGMILHQHSIIFSDNSLLLASYCFVCFQSGIFLCHDKNYLRPVHTRELVPETSSLNTLPGKYPNQYTQRTQRGN